MEVLVKYRWINHDQNIISQFANFWKQEMFADCTILCEEKKFLVHRLVLASSSEYFKEVLDNAQCCHPIIIMDEISSEDLQILLDYIYQVKIVIPQGKLQAIIEEGRALKIKGFEDPNQLLSNTSSNAKSDVAEKFRLFQKSLSPIVSVTKLSEFSMKRKVPKEWDVKNKIRKIDSTCGEEVQVTKNWVQNEDTILPPSCKTSDLEHILKTNEDDVEFIGFDPHTKQGKFGFIQEEKMNVESIFNDVKPDSSIFPDALSLEVLTQKPDGVPSDEKIVKEEVKIAPLPSETFHSLDSLPSVALSTSKCNQSNFNIPMEVEIKEEVEDMPSPLGEPQSPDSLPTMPQSAVEHSLSSEATKTFEGKLMESSFTSDFSSASSLPSNFLAVLIDVPSTSSWLPQSSLSSVPPQIQKPQIDLKVTRSPTDDETLMPDTKVIPTSAEYETLKLHAPVVPSPTDGETLMPPNPIVPMPQECEAPLSPTPVMNFVSLPIKNNDIYRCTSTPEREPRNESQRTEEEMESASEESEQPGPKVQMKHTHHFKCKKNCCPYCMTFQANLNRHMIRKHEKETKVIEFTSLPKNSAKRKKIHDELRLLGNFKHNSRVLKMGSGEIIPTVRSSKTNKIANDYVPCRNCFGFFSKYQLWRHNKTCKEKNKVHLSGRRVIGHGLNLLCTNSVSSSFKKNILSNMISDDINSTVRNDSLILKFGEQLFSQHPEISRTNYIRKRMRELAKFLHKIRKLDSGISSLADVINPGKFEVVVEATKQLSGFDGTSHFQKGSLVTKVGSYLRKCAEIVSGMGFDEGSEVVLNNAEFFINRIDREWSPCLSSLALRDVSAKKFNKPRYLPLIKDIQCLNKFIEDETKSSYQKLSSFKTEAVIDGEEKEVLKQTWHYLAKLTQSSIVLFNKKKSEEVSNITLENYSNGLKGDLFCPDLDETTFENALTKYFRRIEIVGKKGHQVPVIFSKMNIKCIDLLTELRSIVGVSKENLYLLPMPNNGSLHPMNGCESLKEIAHATHLQKPELMLSTNLHKHIATMSQVLNLTQSELEELCKFMGLEARIDAHCCPLPEDAVQLGKITKLLLAAQNGQVSNNDNINLSDITVSEEDLVPDFEGCCPDSNHEEEEFKDGMKSDRAIEGASNDVIDTGDARKHEASSSSNRYASSSSDTMSDIGIQQDIEEAILQTRPSEPRVRKIWSSQEIHVTKNYFSVYIRKQKLPGKKECDQFLTKNPKIKRTWTQVKNFIRNNITAINRKAI